ncbi:Unknown protein sequence [Pseudomonas savastanoi pv. phaseolicola]|nr:Unknown protein sequence [Pseudomonas savastanoi pv. phaseolicola]KPC35109.1 Unknown protein sequence [Pseudomonas savastanoi pv. glycinea]
MAGHHVFGVGEMKRTESPLPLNTSPSLLLLSVVQLDVV